MHACRELTAILKTVYAKSNKQSQQAMFSDALAAVQSCERHPAGQLQEGVNGVMMEAVAAMCKAAEKVLPLKQRYEAVECSHTHACQALPSNLLPHAPYTSH